ncbi:lipid-A-disaccharide synthase [Stenomitos frigidus]|uniref:Lipid-A-disaccharide synthase n=1 Tax=Stenomitos frigidus ULC18 TaxID=2107698 RepID=A0A2T1E389_9CYAN|nr:lipid-A-disaccharide synthase [Stenomitos frigidus]PSB27084.1 lipid-A-disaccharide synthase [Stenomitos frigidus ULC18]
MTEPRNETDEPGSGDVDQDLALSSSAVNQSPAVNQASRTVRIFISTGEVSGDLQGSLLIQALKRQSEHRGLTLELLAMGGDRMAAAGATLLAHTSAIGSMGIFESLPFVLPTLRVQRQAKQYLQQYPPDLVVLIDYMGPNLAFCEYFPERFPDAPIVYYIAPQEWVWGDRWPWGVKLFRSDLVVKATKRILAIFPGEASYFRRKGGQVAWVGHPLLDRMQGALNRESARLALGISSDQVAIVLLPASRQQELKYLMPVMFEAARQIQAKLPEVHFWIPLALTKYRALIEQAIQRYGLQATILAEPQAAANDSAATSLTLQAIAAADLAITKSGTVNLEIALLNVPQVVMYKVNPVTAWILDRLLKISVPFVSPPNLVEMRSIVPEFLQDEATPENLVQASLALLLDANSRETMLAGYQEMRRSLGEAGVCDRAAQEILNLVVDQTVVLASNETNQ